MIKTTSPAILISAALLASICHQTLSFQLPIPSRDEQCRTAGHTGACDFEYPNGKIEYNCMNLRCGRGGSMMPSGEIVYMHRFGQQPVDGTYCGPFSYCLNGDCVYSVEKSQKLRYTGPETKLVGCN